MPISNVNSIIKLSPNFKSDRYRSENGGKTTFHKSSINSSTVMKIYEDLKSTMESQKQTLTDNFLVTVRFKTIISKTRLLKKLFSERGRDPSDFVVGSRYWKEKNNGIISMYHQMTFYLTESNLTKTLKTLKEASAIIEKKYDGVFKNEYLDRKYADVETKRFEQSLLSKTFFHNLMCDISVIDKIFFYKNDSEAKNNSLFSLFNIFKTTDELEVFLEKVGIKSGYHIYDSSSVLVTGELDARLLLDNAPYVVMQHIYDMDKVLPDSYSMSEHNHGVSIDLPSGQPKIGVFDSYFDHSAYFDKWVECVPCLPEGLEITQDDKIHGTKICNLIVDGPRLNSWLEDNCGNFQVKLFEVAVEKKVYFNYIYDNLERIINNNRDIKVWNMSIGSAFSVNPNEISLLAEKIDYVSKKYDVLFVISGTNLHEFYPNETSIGSPADSLNAIVVNSVDRNGNPAPYTRTGPVLTLYTKPDVSYYGGVKGDELIAYSSNPNKIKCEGTSFATPWICRKLAYLIHYYHIDPIVAKAMIIDAASRWEKTEDYELRNLIGYGVVPKTIEKIIYSDSDEIKFYFSDKTLDYRTILATIPVPLNEENQMFYYTAKATLCYFVEGNRKKGVDYCPTEMDLKFGRCSYDYYKDGEEKISIDSLDNNTQYDSDSNVVISPQEACQKFQKWNNTKHLVKPIGKTKRGLKRKNSNYWGVSITQINRFSKRNQDKNKYQQPFGIVVTLKEIHGDIAPINKFVNDCNELKLKPIVATEEYSVDLYLKSRNTIEWE